MILPTRDRAPRKRSETRDLVAPMIRALNRLPGVRVVRNANLGPVVPWRRRLEPDVRPIVAGLGTGSADIVGVVMCDYALTLTPLGRLFALEVKLPAAPWLKAGVLRPDQRRWLETVRRFGGFAAVVHSEAEAREAVMRCRQGLDQ